MAQTETLANKKLNMQKGAEKGSKSKNKSGSKPSKNTPASFQKPVCNLLAQKMETVLGKAVRGEWDLGPWLASLDRIYI